MAASNSERAILRLVKTSWLKEGSAAFIYVNVPVILDPISWKSVDTALTKLAQSDTAMLIVVQECIYS